MVDRVVPPGNFYLGWLSPRDKTKTHALQEGQQATGLSVRQAEISLWFILGRLDISCPCSLQTFQISSAWTDSIFYPIRPFEYQVTPWIFLSSTSKTEADIDATSDIDPTGESITVEVFPTPRLVELPALDVGDKTPTAPGAEEIEFTVTPSSTPDIIIHGFGVIPIRLTELLSV